MAAESDRDVPSLQEAERTIQDIAMSKGVYTDTIRRKAQEAADRGDCAMLQLIKGHEELKTIAASSLEM